jgi:hypothetical protein
MKAVQKKPRASRAITPACGLGIHRDWETTQMETGQARGDKRDHAPGGASAIRIFPNYAPRKSWVSSFLRNILQL